MIDSYLGKVGPTWKGLFGSEQLFADGTKTIHNEDYLRQSIPETAAKVVSGFDKSDTGMPSYEGVITDAQIESLILYIKTLQAPPRPPNIVIIFTDDQGYADVGVFGAKGFKTPNLDRWRAKGGSSPNFHVAQPVCSASRTAYVDRVLSESVLAFTGRSGRGAARNQRERNDARRNAQAKGLRHRHGGQMALGRRHAIPADCVTGSTNTSACPTRTTCGTSHPEAKKGTYRRLCP